MKLFDFFESRDMCNVCGQTPCNCTHITESVANPGRRLIELFNLIYRNGGDDAVDYLLYNSPIFADYYDQYEGDLESIAAEVGPKELAVMVDELEEVAENEGLAENVDIGKEWMSDTELDQYVPDALEQEWRELVGYNEDGNAHPLWINMTGDYEPRSSDPQHRAWMVKVANKWFAKKKIPNVTFFDVRDHDTEDELEWLVQIGQQGVAEGYDTEELANEVYAEFERTYPNLARRADERTIHAAIVDVLNYGGDNDAGALAQDVARAVKQQMQQGVAEMDKSQPSHGRDGKISHSTYGSRDKQSTVGGKEHTVKAVTAKQASKDALNILKKQGVAEQRITPVAPVLSTQNVRTYPPQQIYTPPSGQSRTPPKPPTSGGGGPKPAAILDIQNVPISETISGLDLADAIFKALNQMEGDVVRQYGHDVVGDAIMDVVDEYGEIGSMSDLDMAVQDVLEKLQSLTKTNVQESRHYFATAGTGAGELRNKFGLRKDSNGWFLSESHENFRKLYLEATRTFTEYDLSKHTVSADTIGDDNFVSPVGSVPRGQQKQKVKKNG